MARPQLEVLRPDILKGIFSRKYKTFFLFVIVFLCSKITNTLAISSENAAEKKNQNITTPVSNFTHKNLSMCDVSANGSVSDPYCKCSDSVINCDFANVTSEKPLMVHVSARKIKESIKRICICNTNRNVYLALRKQFLPPDVRVHRMDFYNLNAEIDFAPFGYLNFGGDLYMSKVKFLNRIQNSEFGRVDFEVEDVQDLECCSKMKTAPFNRPTLYIENTTIGSIESQGIHPSHLWKTIVFKFVRIQNGMEKIAILLHDGVNASFSDSFFNNLSDRAIVGDNMDNFVMIKSTFNHSCHPLAFGAKSENPNSTIALIGNRFLNVPQLQLEAEGIINWFNFYESWDNDTFVIQNLSTHQNRVLSVEFNTVDKFSIQPNDFPALNNDPNAIFNENILSLCNCSTLRSLSLPSLFKNHNQRCDAHFETKNSKCTLNLQRFMDKCQKSTPIISKLCQDSTIRLPLVESTQLVNLTFHAINLKFNSPFVVRMIKENEKDCLYRMQKVVQYSKLFTYTEEEFEANDSIEYFEECSNKTDNQYQSQSPAKNESSSTSKSSKSASGLSAKTIFLIVFSMILTFVGGVSIVYLVKRKFLSRSSRRYMSLNTY